MVGPSFGEDERKRLVTYATLYEVTKSRCMKRDATMEEQVINDADYVDEPLLNKNTNCPLPSSASNTVSSASTSTTKENTANLSLENNDCDTDPVLSDWLIEADTMYSRLLQNKNSNQEQIKLHLFKGEG